MVKIKPITGSLYILLLICCIQCKKSDLKKGCFIPYVDFVAYNVDPATLQVSFKSISAFNGKINSYLWDFGDGTTSTDSIPPPHTYPALDVSTPTKTYRIKYTVTNDCGSSFWTNDIKVGLCLPNAKFIFSSINDSTVEITNQTTSSTNASYFWDFGDVTNSTSAATVITKAYKRGGTYNISLKATNACGDNFYTQSVVIRKLPSVTTTIVSSINSNSAISGGNVSDDGGASVSTRGVCWSTSPNPTIASTKTSDGGGTGGFTSSLTGLSPNTKYYVRAYATSSSGTAYGNELNFTTGIALPTLTTAPISSITATTAITGGNISSDNGSAVTARGVCWSNSPGPTISNIKTTDGTGVGTFTSSMTGLSAGTTYYVRAYATNAGGTAYGNEISFTTPGALAILTTTAPSSITPTSAISGGNISAQGGFPVTSRGVCWSTSSNPTINSTKTTDGTGTGVFTSILIGLSPNTKYYVRAYATNNSGTAYGNEFNFTTAIALPTLTTSAISSITFSSAMSGGNISSDNGSPVTARGVCWSNLPGPTTSNSKTIDGTGVGTFSSSITGLSPNTTYYVRAYATNAGGTAYGNEISFSTTGALAILTTAVPGSITPTSSVSGGNISSQGGSAVTSRGVCWSTSSNPTINDSKTTNGAGIGSFSSNITGLLANTTYFVRAYATNSSGTAYGNQQSFTTTGYSLRSVGPAGGLIFYDKGVYSNGWRYLEAASGDQSSSAKWGCSGTSVNTSSAIGAGPTNTTAIVNSCPTAGIAARICSELTLNGFSDWFLPCDQEIKLMYQNLRLFGVGNFSNNDYWTSNQASGTNALVVDFNDGNSSTMSKTNNARVRAIRAF